MRLVDNKTFHFVTMRRKHDENVKWEVPLIVHCLPLDEVIRIRRG